MTLPPQAPALRAACISLTAALLLPGCQGESTNSSAARRDTLPNGVVTVTYDALPRAPADTFVAVVRIGSVDASEGVAFGDVRGIEVGADGTIYVLDFQASEVRAFTPGGEHIATLTRRGEGPGELLQANGMVFDGAGTLWVQDHGQFALIGLSPAGTELTRRPMMVTGYGFVWNVTVDDDGVFWQPWSHSDPRPGGRKPGLHAGSYRRYYKSFDPKTASYDSVFLGEATSQAYMIQYEGGNSVFGLPFDTGPITAMDRTGAIWTGSSDLYRLARLNRSGDTTLVLSIDELGPPITAEDRDDWLERFNRFQERAPALKAELAALFPERKPVFDQLIVDDERRLWVRRSVPRGESPAYDVFDAEGEYLARVRMPPDMHPYIPFVIRRGRLYGVVRDSLDVPYVVAGPVPALESF